MTRTVIPSGSFARPWPPGSTMDATWSSRSAPGEREEEEEEEAGGVEECGDFSVTDFFFAFVWMLERGFNRENLCQGDSDRLKGLISLKNATEVG